jgi:4-hydroxybenzoate polyprenyltransferase
VRLSYRVAGAPLALGIAYVVVPYSLGITAAQGSLRHGVSALTCALFLLFAARIVLKDFRDRVGDARYGKPTLLLRFGKTTTCVASLTALVAGDVVLVVALEPVLWTFVQAFVVAIAAMLWTLWRADGQIAEQVAIGIGARMGNGILLCVLGWLLLEGNGASVAQAALFTAFLSAPFFVSFVSLATRPGEAVIGYKG